MQGGQGGGNPFGQTPVVFGRGTPTARPQGSNEVQFGRGPPGSANTTTPVFGGGSAGRGGNAALSPHNPFAAAAAGRGIGGAGGRVTRSSTQGIQRQQPQQQQQAVSPISSWNTGGGRTGPRQQLMGGRGTGGRAGRGIIAGGRGGFGGTAMQQQQQQQQGGRGTTSTTRVTRSSVGQQPGFGATMQQQQQQGAGGGTPTRITRSSFGQQQQQSSATTYPRRGGIVFGQGGERSTTTTPAAPPTTTTTPVFGKGAPIVGQGGGGSFGAGSAASGGGFGSGMHLPSATPTTTDKTSATSIFGGGSPAASSSTFGTTSSTGGGQGQKATVKFGHQPNAGVAPSLAFGGRQQQRQNSEILRQPPNAEDSNMPQDSMGGGGGGGIFSRNPALQQRAFQAGDNDDDDSGKIALSGFAGAGQQQTRKLGKRSLAVAGGERAGRGGWGGGGGLASTAGDMGPQVSVVFGRQRATTGGMDQDDEEQSGTEGGLTVRKKGPASRSGGIATVAARGGGRGGGRRGGGLARGDGGGRGRGRGSPHMTWARGDASKAAQRQLPAGGLQVEEDEDEGLEEEEEGEVPQPTRGRTQTVIPQDSRDRTPSPSTSSRSSSASPRVHVDDASKRALTHSIKSVMSHNHREMVKAAVTSTERRGDGAVMTDANGNPVYTPPASWGKEYSQTPIALKPKKKIGSRPLSAAATSGGGGASTAETPLQSNRQAVGGAKGAGNDEGMSGASTPALSKPTKKRAIVSSGAGGTIPPLSTRRTVKQQDFASLPQQRPRAIATATTPSAPLTFASVPSPAPGVSIPPAISFGASQPPPSQVLRGHTLPPPPQPSQPHASMTIMSQEDDEKDYIIKGERIQGATSKEGTCMAMCPEGEIKKRKEMGPNKLEMRPGIPPEHTIIKDLERDPPADYPEDMIRPLEWLVKSVDYMEDELMDKGREGTDSNGRPFDTDRDWGQVTDLENYKFHFQRLRMVSKEFTMQNYSYGGKICARVVNVMERLTRYWIIYLHHMNDNAEFVANDAAQNYGQFRNSFDILKGLYEYARLLDQEGLVRHEAEFRAYAILQYEDIKLVMGPRGDKTGVAKSPEVRLAVSILACRATKNYARFFRILRQAPYLLACLMTKYVREMRTVALDTMVDALNIRKDRAVTIPKQKFMESLCLGSEDELMVLAETRDWIHVALDESNIVLKRSQGGGGSAVRQNQQTQVLSEQGKKKAAAAAILQQQFPFIPFIESKMSGMRFSELTRGIKGNLRLSPEAFLPLAMLKRGSTGIIRQRQVMAAPTLPLPPPQESAAAQPASEVRQMGKRKQSPPPSAPVANPSPPAQPSPRASAATQQREAAAAQAEREKKKEAERERERQIRQRLLQQQQQQKKQQVAAEEKEERVRKQRWAICRVAQYGVLEAFGKWIECIATLPSGLASGVRALNLQREGSRSKESQKTEGVRTHATRANEKKRETGGEERSEALTYLVHRVARLHDLNCMKAVMAHWVEMIQQEKVNEAKERERFEATMRGDVSPPMRGPLVELQWGPHRPQKRRRRSPSRSLVTLSSIPLDLVVGPKLWAKHEEHFGYILNALDDPPPPSLIGWKLVVHAQGHDPTGAWVLNSLTHPDALGYNDDASSSQKGRSLKQLPPSHEAGSLFWKQRHSLDGPLMGQEGVVVDMALCVKVAGRSRAEEKEAAHAVIFHLPERSYLPQDEAKDYWVQQGQGLRKFMASVTPGIPLVICLGPEALHAVKERFASNADGKDERQLVAEGLGLGQRGFLQQDEEAACFDWEVLCLQEGIGRVEDGGMEEHVAARDKFIEAIGYLVDASPAVPLVMRETLFSLVSDALERALWHHGHEGAWEMSPEECRRLVNSAIADVKSRLCSDEIANSPWPLAEFAVEPADGSGEPTVVAVPQALWWDVSQRFPLGGGGGLPVGWNDLDRLMRLENLLTAIQLPPFDTRPSRDSPPIRWLDRYLHVLGSDTSTGWNLVPSPSLFQFARELLLSAHQQWGLDGRDSLRNAAPWNRLFTAMVMDRLSVACDSSSLSAGRELDLGWAYSIRSSPLPPDDIALLLPSGATLLEYEEMDLDEGHRMRLYEESSAIITRANNKRKSWPSAFETSEAHFEEEYEGEEGTREEEEEEENSYLSGRKRAKTIPGGQDMMRKEKDLILATRGVEEEEGYQENVEGSPEESYHGGRFSGLIQAIQQEHEAWEDTLNLARAFTGGI